jgi:hypothetical protein
VKNTRLIKLLFRRWLTWKNCEMKYRYVASNES